MAVNKKITELDEIVTPVEGDKLLIIDVSEADDNDKPKQVDFIDFKGDTGEQGIQGIQGVQGDDGQGVPYALDTGSANAYAIDVSSDPLSYTAGDIYSFKASNANTGASTLNVDTLGAKTIKKNVSDDLETGDILANQIITVIYDGTNFQVVSGSGSSETATTIGALIGGADDATPNDTDFVATSLTAAGILKKITWTNVKAFLKTYFDTLYSTAVKATGAEINTGTDDAKFATPKAIEDSNISFITDEEALQNKNLQGSSTTPCQATAYPANTGALDDEDYDPADGVLNGAFKTGKSGTGDSLQFGTRRASGTQWMQAQKWSLSADRILSIQPLGGNTGFGTLTPASTVDVNGSLDKNSGSFKIDHPLQPKEKFLRYGFVESPRFDLIHRGRVKLKNGKAKINIDKEYGMTKGTFDKLCQNKEVACLQAINSFLRVKATEIIDGEFEIECEENSNIDVNWIVIGERADAWIKYTKETDDDGHLINEIEKEELKGDELIEKTKEVKTKKDVGEELREVDMTDKKGFYRSPEAHGEEKPKRKIIKKLKKTMESNQ